LEAGSSACDQISKRFSAYLNVEMERARMEWDEHRMECLAAANTVAASAGFIAAAAGSPETSSARVDQSARLSIRTAA
jgi:hypothetical protein